MQHLSKYFSNKFIVLGKGLNTSLLISSVKGKGVLPNHDSFFTKNLSVKEYSANPYFFFLQRGVL